MAGALRQGKAEQSVLIHGASGGVGSFAVQLARWAGARVATTCSTGNIDYVKGLGAERAIDYRKEYINDALRSWAPEGVDLVFDVVGPGLCRIHSICCDPVARW
jgi:NADPH2:quinone reductase